MTVEQAKLIMYLSSIESSKIKHALLKMAKKNHSVGEDC